MPRTTDLMTADQLLAMPDDGKRHELVAGVLQTMPLAGFRHGRIAAKLLQRIGDHVERHQLGETFATGTGFLLQRDPDTVRAPDAAFVSMAALGELRDYPGYLPLAPDLVAEVLSPGDRSNDVEDKELGWLAAGVRIVLVVDPQTATIRVYRPNSQVQVHSEGFIDLSDMRPGFQLDVVELFA